MSDLREEINPHLVETWKLFDTKARSLDVQYNISADEPSVQAFLLPYKSSDDQIMWKGIADYMYNTENIKNGKIILKVDPGFKKGEVLFSFTVGTINDTNTKLYENIVSLFRTQPHITFHIKPDNSRSVTHVPATPVPTEVEGPKSGPEIPVLGPTTDVHKMPESELHSVLGSLLDKDMSIADNSSSSSDCQNDIQSTFEDMLKERDAILLRLQQFISKLGNRNEANN